MTRTQLSIAFWTTACAEAIMIGMLMTEVLR